MSNNRRRALAGVKSRVITLCKLKMGNCLFSHFLHLFVNTRTLKKHEEVDEINYGPA